MSAAVEELCCLVKELQVESSSLCLIREDERDITQFFLETLLFKNPNCRLLQKNLCLSGWKEEIPLIAKTVRFGDFRHQEEDSY